MITPGPWKWQNFTDGRQWLTGAPGNGGSPTPAVLQSVEPMLLNVDNAGPIACGWLIPAIQEYLQQAAAKGDLEAQALNGLIQETINNAWTA